ncbi:MAG: metalloregulator ArsR/SmtB family transcription factor [bacterium]
MKKGLPKETYQKNAKFYKILSNPKRLEVLNLLKSGEMGVEELLDITKIPKENLSQHLSILKEHHLVRNRREGLYIFYTITDKRIVDSCKVLQDLRNRKIIK